MPLSASAIPRAFLLLNVLVAAIRTPSTRSKPEGTASNSSSKRNASDPLLRGAGAPPGARALASAGRTSRRSNQSMAMKALPCTCQASDPKWAAPTRTTPKCIFIDLGAANGNTFNHFIKNGYGPVQNCPNGGDYEAFLVEANPRFQPELSAVAQAYPGKVHNLGSTAAFMCEAQAEFFLDTVNHGDNYWGSSMSSNHPDVKRSGQQKVVVPTMNLMRLLHEQTITGDWVMVKMDIEGGEWDVIPCLAQSPEATRISRLYLEDHYHLGDQLGLGTTTRAEYEQAKVTLRQRHVDIPEYFSYSL